MALAQLRPTVSRGPLPATPRPAVGKGHAWRFVLFPPFVPARAAPAPATPAAGCSVRGWPCWRRKTALFLRSTAQIGRFSRHTIALVRQLRCEVWPATSPTRPLSPRPKGSGCPALSVVPLPAGVRVRPAASRRSPSWARGRGRLVVAENYKVKSLASRAASRHGWQESTLRRRSRFGKADF